MGRSPVLLFIPGIRNVLAVGETVVIKSVDKASYRKLKSKAAKEGLKIGQAASMAFRAWAEGERLRRVSDTDKMKLAAEIMDRNRSKLKQIEGWSSVKVIRRWRQARRT